MFFLFRTSGYITGRTDVLQKPISVAVLTRVQWHTQAMPLPPQPHNNASQCSNSHIKLIGQLAPSLKQHLTESACVCRRRVHNGAAPNTVTITSVIHCVPFANRLKYWALLPVAANQSQCWQCATQYGRFHHVVAETTHQSEGPECLTRAQGLLRCWARPHLGCTNKLLDYQKQRLCQKQPSITCQVAEN